jgi:hypothetical protein
MMMPKLISDEDLSEIRGHLQVIEENVVGIRETTNTVALALKEVRGEITRVNNTAGSTIFNPAATQLLDTAIQALEGLDIG